MKISQDRWMASFRDSWLVFGLLVGRCVALWSSGLLPLEWSVPTFILQSVILINEIRTGLTCALCALNRTVWGQRLRFRAIFRPVRDIKREISALAQTKRSIYLWAFVTAWGILTSYMHLVLSCDVWSRVQHFSQWLCGCEKTTWKAMLIKCENIEIK